MVNLLNETFEKERDKNIREQDESTNKNLRNMIKNNYIRKLTQNSTVKAVIDELLTFLNTVNT